MTPDTIKINEMLAINASNQIYDPVLWHAHLTIEKFDENFNLVETLEIDGNLLVTAGATILWNGLIGTAITPFSNANANLGVGDSNTAENVAQTDLQAASNKFRKAMDATYPQVSGNTITFKATFGSSEANFTWAEWGLFNANAAGTMLNRKVQAMGTKVSGATWAVTATITLS